MTRISANIEWMFTEQPSPADRIHAAARAGLSEIEMWGWRDKDLTAIEHALQETGVRLLSLIVDPQLQLTDPSALTKYPELVAESRDVAPRLRAPNLVTVAGQHRPETSTHEQRSAVVAALRAGSAELDGTDVTLLRENLSDRVDHPGTYLHSVRAALDIIRDVKSPKLRLLLDAYHAAVMGEDIVAAIG